MIPETEIIFQCLREGGFLLLFLFQREKLPRFCLLLSGWGPQGASVSSREIRQIAPFATACGIVARERRRWNPTLGTSWAILPSQKSKFEKTRLILSKGGKWSDVFIKGKSLKLKLIGRISAEFRHKPSQS